MKKFERNLRQLLDTPIDLSLFPFERDGVLYIGEHRIIQQEHYLIKCADNIFPVGRTYTKLGAIALVKSHILRRDRKSRILYHDRELYNRQNDMMFYKHVMQTTEDSEQHNTVLIRLELAESAVETSRRYLISNCK